AGAPGLSGGDGPDVGSTGEGLVHLHTIWSFDPSSRGWEELSTPEESPDRRAWSVGGFDWISKVFVVYGGVLDASGGKLKATGETWLFDPGARRWHLIEESLHDFPARTFAAGAFCPCSGELFVVGGNDSYYYSPGLSQMHKDAFFLPIERKADFTWDGAASQ